MSDPASLGASEAPWWRELDARGRPRVPEDLWPIYEDFRNFLFLVWEHLGLPEPTEAQYEIAHFLQHGFGAVDPAVGRADIIMAFRGIGKSYITAAFCLWRLLRDPVNEKILVISASSGKAKKFVHQCKAILSTMPILAHLRPRPDQRDSFDRFDVNGASMAQSCSLTAAGITGQITGDRATLIVPDDVEVPANSKTEESREWLLQSVLEFEAIKVPAQRDASGTITKSAGDVIFLGTPQSLESIYFRKIREGGYGCFCLPARHPTADKYDPDNPDCAYIVKRDDGTRLNILAPYLRERLALRPGLAGKPTDPKRFPEADLIAREAKGRAYFLLQYMLDTSLSDAEKYPLKQHDLVVMALNPTKAPMTVQWGRHNDRRNVLDDIPNVGFTGDHFLGPLFIDENWRPYTGSVLFVDPAGRGKDETAWSVLKVLNGMMFALKVGALQGAPVDEAYLKIATDARDFDVNLVLIEPNFAPGIWIAGFHPVLQKVWKNKTIRRGDGSLRKIDPAEAGCTVMEAEWARGQKELRIIDTLEPVMNTHRLVVDESVARDEVLMYQLTHITRERGSLSHDDRLDALAGAVGYFVKVLELDADDAASRMREEEFDQQLEDFVEFCLRGGSRSHMKARGRSREDYEVYTS